MRMQPGADQVQYSSALGCSICVVVCVLLAAARRGANMCLSSIRTVKFKWRSGGGPVGARFSIGKMDGIVASMYMHMRQADGVAQQEWIARAASSALTVPLWMC